MSKTWKRFLSLMLALVMVLSLGVTGFAEDGDTEELPADTAEETGVPETGETAESGRELEMEPLNPDQLHIRKLGLEEDEDELGQIVPMEGEDLNTVVRASIFLDEPSTLAAGYSAEGIGSNEGGTAYRNGLRARQDAITAQIESVIGHELNVHWNLTLAVNAISADLSLAEMIQVREIPGVKCVQRENQYLPMDDGEIAEPNTASTSEYMVGAADAWADGYTGAGSRIAIIDTGIDTSHQSFASESFDHAIAEVRASGKTVELMTSIPSGLNGSGVSFGSKIPYGYNYVDKSTTITHVEDTQGEHGSHVAGIASANRFIKNGSTYTVAASEVGAVGMAPDAQLLIMKVFGSSGGAYDSDYMVAIEDAMVLGADVANLSLGSSVQGWTFSNEYQDLILGWANGEHNGKMVLSISAGNSYDLAKLMPTQNLYIEDVDMHTGGSPGTFVNSLCVAAAQNTTTTGTPMRFNNNLDVYYNESTQGSDGTSYTNPELTTIVGTYQYVYIDAVGEAADYSAVNSAMSLSGKIVIVNRGDISFSEKGNNAKNYSPKALIVANNTDGTIGMDLSDYTGSFPMVSITLKSAMDIKAGGTAHAVGNYIYYTGSVTVTNTETSYTIDRSDAFITDFSSWGVPGSLLMKPEITAPGGDIYSVAGTNRTSSGGTAGGSDQYEYMSGTSMAAPHIAGLAAVLAQYLRENNLPGKNSGLSGLSTRTIAQSLMMSTATPMAPDGSYLSILQQGAGLVDVSRAVTANSVIMMDPGNSALTGSTGAAADGKVKVELGDDPGREGDYSFGFTVYNLTNDDLHFSVSTDMFTQAANGAFMSRGTAGIGASAACWWAPLQSGSIQNSHDVNQDGATNADDAQAILDYLTGETDEEELDLSVADLDDDEFISSQDAYLLLDWISGQGGTLYENGVVPANGSRYCAVRITLPQGVKAYLDETYPCGAYLEGFTYVTCDSVAKDGASNLCEHSIPILGFYGSWTDATMFDTNSYVEALYGNEQESYTGNDTTNYLTMVMNGSTVLFSGNPYMVEDSFPADRLAVNSNTTIGRIAYNLVRAAGTTGYAVSSLDAEGNVAEVVSSTVTGNNVSGIYYSPSGGWQGLTQKFYNVNKTAGTYGFKEGDRFRIGYYAIPEYNAMRVNKDYTSASAGVLDLDGFNSLLTSNVLGKGAFVGYDFVVDNTDPSITRASLNGSSLTVSAADNLALAYVAVLSLDGETVYSEAAPGTDAYSVTFDASEAIANAHGYVAVFAGDYAGNEVAVAGKVNDDCYEERTVYVLTDSITAGGEYLIANKNAASSGVALGHAGTTAATNSVTIRRGGDNTGNRVYIDSNDVADTSVWTVSNGYKFANGGYYLRQSGGSLSITNQNSNNSWTWDDSNCHLSTGSMTKYYLCYSGGSFTLSRTAASVYLYEKTVIMTEVDPYGVTSVRITPDTLELYKGNTADLSAKVLPLTAQDRTVSWSSSDENVATVDDHGKVTAVGAGNAAITASSNSDPSIQGECNVTVTVINKKLNGIVWDEEGKVYFSDFNANSMPAWNKLHSNEVGTYLTSAFMANASSLYAGTLNTSDVSTTIYSVDRSTYALTEYGQNYVGAFGMARASSSSSLSDYMLYCYAKYLIVGNLKPQNNSQIGGTYSGIPFGLLDLSETDVGDAYVAGVCARSIGSTSSSFFILDETGKIWQVSLKYSTLGGWQFGDSVSLVVDTGISTSVLYQSIYYDGNYLYWTHCTGEDCQLMIIVPSTKQVFNAGNFGENVWPVAGLYVDGAAAPASVGDEPMDEEVEVPLEMEIVATREDLMTEEVLARLAASFSAFGAELSLELPEEPEEDEGGNEGFIEEEEGTIESVGSIGEPAPVEEPDPSEEDDGEAASGSLTAFRGASAGAPEARRETALLEMLGNSETVVTIDIAEEEQSHNGLISVAYDPELAGFRGWSRSEDISNISVHVDEDKNIITLAYANKGSGSDEIPAGKAIVKLLFALDDPENIGCGVIGERITLERSEELELNEQSDLLVPGASGHQWSEPTWDWAADFSSAAATFVCSVCEEERVLDADVTSRTENGVTIFTATVELDGVIYTDTKTDAPQELTITAQPGDVTCKAGEVATFTVLAEGTDLYYQWYYQKPGSETWTAVSAAVGKTSTYSLTAAERHNGYRYKCVVSNGSASVESETALLTVYVKPVITVQPENITVVEGQTASFSVEAAGMDLSYRWYYRTSEEGSWTLVSAASGKTANYSLTAASRHNGYQYRCKVSNLAGSVYTQVVTLTVEPAVTMPTIATQPKTATGEVGATVHFTIKAQGGDLSYQWYYRLPQSTAWKAVNAASGKTADYSLKVAERHNGYQYRCKVTNRLGTVTSKTVMLNVAGVVPVIVTQPKDLTVVEGDKAIFTVKAAGTDLSYQWQYRTTETGPWKNIIAESSRTAKYILNTAARHNGYQYQCVITNPQGTVTTKIVTLTLTAPEQGQSLDVRDR